MPPRKNMGFDYESQDHCKEHTYDGNAAMSDHIHLRVSLTWKDAYRQNASGYFPAVDSAFYSFHGCSR